MNVKSSNIQIPNQNLHHYPPDGVPMRFNTVLLDPPWSIQQKGNLGASTHYNVMTLEEIKALPINELTSDNAHVWLWITNAVVPHIPELMKAWGLTYRSIYTWCKPRLGLGQYLRNCTEQLILCTKGKAAIQFRGQMNWGFMPVQDHSHKPEEVYEIIERCSPGPYLEMFARQRHPGWYAWGNEVPSDIVIDDQPVPEYTEDAKNWCTKKQKDCEVKNE